MNENAEKTFETAAAFQKMWMDTLSKATIAGLTVTPGTPPPEATRQMRAGVFRALSESWEEFMRTPQFMEGMKQYLDGVVSVKKMSNDVLNKFQHEMQSAAKEDIDSIMLNIRHLETRVLDRLEKLEKNLETVAESANSTPPGFVTSALDGVNRRLEKIEKAVAAQAESNAKLDAVLEKLAALRATAVAATPAEAPAARPAATKPAPRASKKAAPKKTATRKTAKKSAK